MTPDRMPPDPWDEEGVDLWTLEKAEEYVSRDLDCADPRWDDLDGPTIEEFDEAEAESERDDADGYGSGLIGGLRPWLGAIALFVVVAMALAYGLR